MAPKSLIERRAKKLSQMQKIKEALAKLENQSAERMGRLAVKAGLGELVIEEDELLKEFETIANKFRGGDKKSPPQKQSAVAEI